MLTPSVKIIISNKKDSDQKKKNREGEKREKWLFKVKDLPKTIRLFVSTWQIAFPPFSNLDCGLLHSSLSRWRTFYRWGTTFFYFYVKLCSYNLTTFTCPFLSTPTLDQICITHRRVRRDRPSFKPKRANPANHFIKYHHLFLYKLSLFIQ